MTSTPLPNILLIVSDEERRNDWLEGHADLPAHDRLRRVGLSFSRHYTHTSPCSPSRASLWTGQYLSQHEVTDNVNFEAHTALDPAIPTVGSLLREQGYESAFFGKWHLAPTGFPDLAAHGYSGWQGDDRHYVGGAWTQRTFDPRITQQAATWLEDRPTDRPWFATVSLLGPHDIMWFPGDQLDFQAENPEIADVLEAIRTLRLAGVEVTPPDDYPERFDRLPDNFDDDLHTKPEIQRAWRTVRNTEHFVGSIDLADTRTWLRQLDYYAWLHEQVDASVNDLLGHLDRLGIADDTAIIYTSDHGDACGSHGLRAKLPCVYEEVMGVPLIVKIPGVTVPGATTDALSTHVDLASTIAALGGVDVAETPSLSGVDLAPVLADPTTSAREVVYFAQDSAQSPLLRSARYAVRGFFDGTTKYARYYGVGGGIERDGSLAPGSKRYDVDAAFEDHDHEWYETNDDPGELINLAHDRSRRAELRENFARLKQLESDLNV